MCTNVLHGSTLWPNMQPEERQVLATALPNTTLLTGPMCNTSVVAAVTECNQSAPLVMALGTVCCSPLLPHLFLHRPRNGHFKPLGDFWLFVEYS